MKFRYDVNALRAFAVISVVTFHFEESLLPGGFVGVDIFFVISGYLMTGIITSRLELQNFSLVDFYTARINRIFPALLVMLLALVLLAFVFFNPLDLKSLSWKVVSSALFLSNIAFTFLGGGYFAESAQANWLLHTWSLSVEWQFYLIYPFIIIVTKRLFGLRAIVFCLLFIFVASLSASVLLSKDYASASYFNLHTRAWQMLAGGLILYIPQIESNTVKKILWLTGVCLIGASSLFFDERTEWPGLAALAPVLGAVFFIYSNVQDSKIIGLKIVQSIGTWSYSIYLWHWPLVVAIYMYGLPDWTKFVGGVLSITLGYLSSRYIENHNYNKSSIKKSLHGIRKTAVNFPLWGAATVSIFAALLYCNEGAEWRVKSKDISAFNEVKKAKVDWYYPEPNLTIQDSKLRTIQGNNSRNILFLGASHIEQTFAYVESRESSYNIYYLTKNGCLPIESYHAPKWSCKNLHTYKALIKNITFDKVAVSAYLFSVGLDENDDSAVDKRKEDIQLLVEFLASNIEEVFLVLPEPYHDSFDPLIHYRRGLDDTVPVETTREKHKLVYSILSEIEFPENMTILDPFRTMCTDLCTVRENGKYVYRDAGHFRPWYAKQAMDYLEPILVFRND